MDKITWFRAGGPAEALFQPADEEDLAAFLKAVPEDIPITIVGIGSNLLVREGGKPILTGETDGSEPTAA